MLLRKSLRWAAQVLGSIILRRSYPLLLVLYHHCQPLFKIFLHSYSAFLQQVLDSFDFGLQVLELIVLLLVGELELADFALQGVLFVCPHNFPVLVYHSSQGVLLADLLDLVGEVFDLSPCRIDILA